MCQGSTWSFIWVSASNVQTQGEVHHKLFISLSHISYKLTHFKNVYNLTLVCYVAYHNIDIILVYHPTLASSFKPTQHCSTDVDSNPVVSLLWQVVSTETRATPARQKTDSQMSPSDHKYTKLL